MQKRAPQWMQNMGLEWLFRLLLEPRRLFKRYFVTNSVFLYLLSRELVKKTFIKKFEPHEMN
jgi:N-acetylglucosaminyldiphosphoundecaprenol N-acetyl-beta-D-mannosaminyltransferase